MAGTGFLIARLEARALEAAAFAPFGTVVEIGGDFDLINDGTTRRYADRAVLDLLRAGRDPVLALYVAQARRFPLPIAKLERHAEAAQVFLPLGAHRFVVVVAPGAQAPRWEGIAAFLTRPGQGVVLRRGCWHHGLVALGDGDRFAVIEGGNYRRDTLEVRSPAAIELVQPVPA